MKIKYYILTILLFVTAHLFAQETKFVAQVTKTTVATGEQFELTFSVNGDAGSFNPPDLNDFQLLSGPNTSNSMEFVNGKATSSSSVSYILTPVRVGTFTIGPATAIINGKKMSTNPIKMTVVKGRPSRRSYPLLHTDRHRRFSDNGCLC